MPILTPYRRLKALLCLGLCLLGVACLVIGHMIHVSNLLIDGIRRDDIPLLKKALHDGASPNIQAGIFPPTGFKETLEAVFAFRKNTPEGMFRKNREVPMLFLTFYSSIGWDGHYHTLPILKLLVDAGANPNVRESDGTTVLIQVVHYDEPSIIDDLISHGADINAADEYGETALIRAARWGKNHCLKRLLDHHPPLETRDCFGKTALIVASEYNQLDAVKILLAHGADVHARSYAGRTAVDVAGKYYQLMPSADSSLRREIIDAIREVKR